MKSDKITFVVGVYNEENRIELVLRNFYGWGRILVIDNFSTDRTLEIARKYTDNIVQYQNQGHSDNEEWFNFMQSKVTTPWIYRGTAGEALPRQLLEKMVEVAEQDRYSVVCISRKAISYGCDTRNSGRGYHPRFHKQGAVSYKDAIIHSIGQVIVPSSQVLKLPHRDEFVIWQFRDYDVSETEKKFTTYLDIDARERWEKRGLHFSPLRLILGTLWIFFSMYLLHGAFLKGWPAFFNAVWGGIYYFNRQARLWEMDNYINLQSIRESHRNMKEKLLIEVENGIKEDRKRAD